MGANQTASNVELSLNGILTEMKWENRYESGV